MPPSCPKNKFYNTVRKQCEPCPAGQILKMTGGGSAFCQPHKPAREEPPGASSLPLIPKCTNEDSYSAINPDGSNLLEGAHIGKHIQFVKKVHLYGNNPKGGVEYQRTEDNTTSTLAFDMKRLEGADHIKVECKEGYKLAATPRYAHSKTACYGVTGWEQFDSNKVSGNYYKDINIRCVPTDKYPCHGCTHHLDGNVNMREFNFRDPDMDSQCRLYDGRCSTRSEYKDLYGDWVVEEPCFARTEKGEVEIFRKNGDHDTIRCSDTGSGIFNTCLKNENTSFCPGPKTTPFFDGNLAIKKENRRMWHPNHTKLQNELEGYKKKWRRTSPIRGGRFN